MEKIKTNSGFKKISKILISICIGLIFLLLCVSFVLSLPFVQTKIAHYAMGEINKEFGTNINVDEVAITFFGGVKLKKVLILDHHNDTLMYSNRVKTSILDFKQLVEGRLLFGDIRLDDFYLQIINYKKEPHTNLDLFVDAFDDGKPGSGKFLMTSKNAYLTNSRFVMIDENSRIKKEVDFTKINANLEDFKIQGPNVTTTIKKMSLKDYRGLYVNHLNSKFTYTKKNIIIDELVLKTKESYLKGKVTLNYNKNNRDFSDFNNRVKFNVDLDNASLASNDIRYFYNELGKNQKFFVKSKIKGTLNNFYLSKLYLNDNNGSVILGDVNFKNLFPKSPGEFYMKGDFRKITSNYNNLIRLLPNILGKKIPTSLIKLGQFNYTGKAEVTQKHIASNFVMNTALGIIESDLYMSDIDNIDNAKYKGNVILDNFEIGKLLDDKTVEKVSLNLEVEGKGFTSKNIATTIVGDISKLTFNGYSYSNIIVDGSLKNPFFNGKFNVNDPNLVTDFDGTIDLSEKEKKYDFHSSIDYANLHKLHFVSDTTSVFKGEVFINATGNTLDDLKGDFTISNASYQNIKDLYFIDDFNINSSFNEDGERAVSIVSPGLINAYFNGRYKIGQLQKIAENSLGSIYANYRPNVVLPNQYLKFDVNINGKLVEIFNPEVSVSEHTMLKGNISSETKEFKLDFVSPKIDVYGVGLKNLELKVDNINDLFNSSIKLDSIKTKNYTISDFRLNNKYEKDSLHFNTEFKGGKKAKDLYKLNFYHTINKENKNVIGFDKSEFRFKDYVWDLDNDNIKDNNKIVFDKKLTQFSFENVTLTHENQKINFFGFMSKKKKDIQLSFENVNLNKVTPDVDKFQFEGNLNGSVNFKQDESVFLPTAALEIKNLFLNEIELGELNVDVKGDESLKSFYVNTTLENKNAESLDAKGEITIADNKTYLDVDLNLEKFNLGVLDGIGGDIITNIRGLATGNTRIEGDFQKLEYNGRLYLEKSGITIPYLNTDYNFEDNSIVDVTENKFIIRDTEITDTKYNTKGSIEGFIKHNQFADWQLDLTIDSNRLLSLDTEDHDEAAYYGTAFIKGYASIVGPADNLLIKVEAESAKGTDIKIPIVETESIQENKYIHFLSALDKTKKKAGKSAEARNYKGLELEFNFKILDNANIEVILNKETGHEMKGKGLGTLLFRINTLGKFEMWGDFIVSEGNYNFKYGNLVDKKFNVKKGGSIIWSGNPMAADLNLEAIYQTTANPSALLDNSSYNKKTETDVIIDVKGNLSNPEPDFNINFPNVGSTLRSEIQYKLNDKDTRQKQAFYLLAFGGFMTEQGATQSLSTNVAIEKASSVFNDLFQNENDKLQLGLVYVSSDRTPGMQTDGRAGVSVSSKINEKFSVNGKVGVPIGGLNQSAIVGDFELQYRVNDDGSLSLRAFTKENDLTYIGQGIGYKQGLGVSYQVDFDYFNEFVKRFFKGAKFETPKYGKKTDINDSNINPELMNIKSQKEKNKQEKEPNDSNKEAIPLED